MSRITMMINVAHRFGFEHEITVDFCHLAENSHDEELVRLCYAAVMNAPIVEDDED